MTSPVTNVQEHHNRHTVSCGLCGRDYDVARYAWMSKTTEEMFLCAMIDGHMDQDVMRWAMQVLTESKQD